MISLRRFHSKERIAINPDLIERIEESPDTVVHMTNGNRYVVEEGIDEISEKVRVFRASLLILASQMTDHPSIARTPPLRVVRGAQEGETIGSRQSSGTYDTGAVEP
ncbi:MAG TPA: flagellar FlbD family protein [Acidimicrobiales bacterium]|nr:flagellar FlbD family protein [Acidimicrobiales bacterium]